MSAPAASRAARCRKPSSWFPLRRASAAARRLRSVRARVLELARGALASIEAARERIDDLNVYPVPDGDTGSNLTLTWRQVVVALAEAATDDRTELAKAATRAALLGARGNSG